MLKVFIIGYDEPYAVVGQYTFEDERFLYLEDGGKKIKIPHKRIAYIEDWEAFVERPAINNTPLTSATMRPKPFPVPPGTPEALRDALLNTPKSELKDLGDQLKGFVSQKMDEQNLLRVSQIEPDDGPHVDSNTKYVDLVVLFTGAKSGQFALPVPEGVFTGIYTPALGREVFSAPDVQAFMSSDIMLDGLPALKGSTVICKTKLTKTMGDVNVKMDVLGQMLAGKAGESLLNKHFKSSPYESGFSMTHSPFDSLPSLLSEPKDEVEE